MTGWTKGPWLREGRTVYAIDESNTVNRFSAHMQGGHVFRGHRMDGERTTQAELEANAHLIAAAPEADELAKRVIARIVGVLNYDMNNTARAELETIKADAEQWRAKARGES